jgi:hypothetical protein
MQVILLRSVPMGIGVLPMELSGVCSLTEG